MGIGDALALCQSARFIVKAQQRTRLPRNTVLPLPILSPSSDALGPPVNGAHVPIVDADGMSCTDDKYAVDCEGKTRETTSVTTNAKNFYVHTWVSFAVYSYEPVNQFFADASGAYSTSYLKNSMTLERFAFIGTRQKYEWGLVGFSWTQGYKVGFSATADKLTLGYDGGHSLPSTACNLATYRAHSEGGEYTTTGLGSEFVTSWENNTDDTYDPYDNFAAKDAKITRHQVTDQDAKNWDGYQLDWQCSCPEATSADAVGSVLFGASELPIANANYNTLGEITSAPDCDWRLVGATWMTPVVIENIAGSYLDDDTYTHNWLGAYIPGALDAANAGFKIRVCSHSGTARWVAQNGNRSSLRTGTDDCTVTDMTYGGGTDDTAAVGYPFTYPQ